MDPIKLTNDKDTPKKKRFQGSVEGMDVSVYAPKDSVPDGKTLQISVEVVDA